MSVRSSKVSVACTYGLKLHAKSLLEVSFAVEISDFMLVLT